MHRGVLAQRRVDRIGVRDEAVRQAPEVESLGEGYDPVLYRAKDPAASKGPWDLYEVLRTIPQGEAFLLAATASSVPALSTAFR
jgi:hypothetical protein